MEKRPERRVGDFTDPKTGEKDWIDVSQLHLLIVANMKHKEIRFDFDNIPEEKVVTLTGTCKKGTATVKMDELEFATKFMDCAYANRPLHEEPWIIEMCDQIAAEINKEK
jgi:hypothetical protein